VGGLLFLAVIVVGILYISRYRDVSKNRDDLKQRQYVNINYFIKLRRTIWLWWGVFAALSILLVTGVNFGSNIWFSRPIHINGPYMLATILVQYLLPLFSIVIPLTFHSIPKLMIKHEEKNEK
jgi:magnesium-transporting ATPase (P-type)